MYQNHMNRCNTNMPPMPPNMSECGGPGPMPQMPCQQQSMMPRMQPQMNQGGGMPCQGQNFSGQNMPPSNNQNLVPGLTPVYHTGPINENNIENLFNQVNSGNPPMQGNMYHGQNRCNC